METQKDQDKQIICQDCQLPFTWTAGEQRFYESLAYSAPKRCPSCRAILKRKIRQQEERRAREVQNG